MLELILSAAAAAPAEHGEAVHAVPSAWGFDPTGWVALAMVAVFALFLWKRVPSAVGKALDKKIDAIRAQLAEAESLRKDAEALKAEYEAKSAAADKEASAMLDRARNEADALLAKARTDAEALVERRGRMAEEKIAAEERAAVDELRATAAQAARDAAERLIVERLDDKRDGALVDQAIGGLAGR